LSAGEFLAPLVAHVDSKLPPRIFPVLAIVSSGVAKGRRAKWAVVVLSVLLAACSTQAAAPPTTKAPRSATTTKLPTTTTTLGASAGCASFDPGPPYSPPSTQLAPFLLTLDDLPAGYASSPSVTLGVLGEFNSAAPRSLLWNIVNYYDTGDPSSYDEPEYFGQSVSEMLGEAKSAQDAQSMLANLNMVNNRCNPGTPVDLPGTDPNVVASVSSGQTDLSAIAYAIKGTYVVQLTWEDLEPRHTQEQLPTAAEMASIVNAALAHLPA
jgi:hypothetical protein